MTRSGFLRAFIAMGGMLLVACGKPPESPKQIISPAPSVVFVTEAQPAPTPAFGQVIAKLEGSANTPVTSTASGFLIKQAYREGALVKKGDLLFVLNPKLSASSSSEYVHIVSPADGVTDRANSAPGDAIARGAVLTTVAQVDPILAEFSIPVAYYHSRISDFSLPKLERAGEFELVLPDGTPYPVKGRLEMANEFTSGINATVSARASFPNSQQILRPGQYARIRDSNPASNGAVTVPLNCIRLDPGPVHVQVVKADDTIELRPVVASPATGSICTITSGLKAGERVVVEGGEKCGPGTKVMPQPYVAPGT